MKQMENTLYKLQTECINILSNKGKEYPQKGLYTHYSLLPFPIVIKQELIKLGYKISKNHLLTLIKNIYIKEGGKIAQISHQEKGYTKYMTTY